MINLLLETHSCEQRPRGRCGAAAAAQGGVCVSVCVCDCMLKVC